MVFGFFHICPIGVKLGKGLGISSQPWSMVGNQQGRKSLYCGTLRNVSDNCPCATEWKRNFLDPPKLWNALAELDQASIFIMNCRVQRDKPSYCDSILLHSTRKVFFLRWDFSARKTYFWKRLNLGNVFGRSLAHTKYEPLTPPELGEPALESRNYDSSQGVRVYKN